MLRHRADALLVAMAAVHAGLLVSLPSIPLVAIGLWWNANTVAHNFIHQPFFRTPALNRLYSCILSATLGFPQTIWRQRHLAHHAGRPVRLQPTPLLACELVVVLATWSVAAAVAPTAFLVVYLPGWAIGLGLCALQGHYEHARGTTSHYSRLYNLLFFNDGYHAEHHRQPGLHWTLLSRTRTAAGTTAATPSASRRRPAADGRVSRWPPVLRWLDDLTLDGLERTVLRVPMLQRMVLHWHERAFRRLLPAKGIQSVVIVGGGLYPRTALVLRRLLPAASITIIDARREHLDIAASFVDRRTVLREAFFRGTPLPGVDLVVIPLALVGCRRAIYEHPPAAMTLVHDWIWHRRGAGAVVSWLLLKRINLIERNAAGSATPVSLSA